MLLPADMGQHQTAAQRPRIREVRVIYKAQWPLAGRQEVCIYAVGDEGKQPLERPTYFLPCSPTLREKLFLGRYIKVYFKGKMLPGMSPVIEEFVRQDEWVDRDPLTGELVP